MNLSRQKVQKTSVRGDRRRRWGYIFHFDRGNMQRLPGRQEETAGKRENLKASRSS